MSLLDSLTRPRTLAVLLCLSLAVNLFLAGAMAGRLSAGHRDGPPPLFGLGVPGFDSGFRFMPHGGKERIRQGLRERMPDLRDEHKALRRMHQDIAEELARDTPDRALIEKKFGEIRTQSLHIEEAMQQAFLDAALAMDPVERKRMLDAIRAHGGRPAHHGPGGPAGGPPQFDAPPPEPGMTFEPAAPPPGAPLDPPEE